MVTRRGSKLAHRIAHLFPSACNITERRRGPRFLVSLYNSHRRLNKARNNAYMRNAKVLDVVGQVLQQQRAWRREDSNADCQGDKDFCQVDVECDSFVAGPVNM